MLPPAAVIERLKEAVHEPEANMYQSYRSLPALRIAFADWYREHFRAMCGHAGRLVEAFPAAEIFFDGVRDAADHFWQANVMHKLHHVIHRNEGDKGLV